MNLRSAPFTRKGFCCGKRKARIFETAGKQCFLLHLMFCPVLFGHKITVKPPGGMEIT